MRALSYIELDLDYCTLEYGVPPCMADGEVKCFNTLKTCQDRAHYTPETRTIRFASDTLDLPDNIPAIPCIQSISFTPGTVSLGQDMGIRTSLNVTFSEFRHSDIGVAGDPYWKERGYDPFTHGTFWARFRARQPFLRGKAIRYIMGREGQTLEEMETRHLVVESFTGPDTNGRYSIVAKDVLKLASGDRSQAPRLSRGSLLAPLGAGDTVLQLVPGGIGNIDYPTSGYVAIGGKEMCAFSRTGDVMSLSRAQFNTAAVDHAAQDRVQLALVYSAMSPADIIHDLLTNYAEGFNPAWITLAAWQLEVDTYLRRLYTAVLADPTDVEELVSELIEQAALALWWDDIEQKVKLKVLRYLPPISTFGPERYLEDSFSSQDQPKERVSEVWTYYGVINPLRSVKDADNYRSARVDLNLQSISDHGTNSIKKIMARWIPAFGAQVAARTNTLTLMRLSNAPRKLSLRLLRAYESPPSLGDVHMVQNWTIQDAMGNEQPIPAQITRINPLPDVVEITAEEATYGVVEEEDFTNRVITIDSVFQNVNLRSLHDDIYPAPDPLDPPIITLILESSVYLYSTQAGVPALNIGNWPAFMAGRINVDIRGIVQGRGGRGGAGVGGDNAGGGWGETGHPGLYTRFPIKLKLSGAIRGGGGGGAGGGGDFVGWFGPQLNGGGGGGGAGFGPGGPPAYPGGPGGTGGLHAGGGGGQNAKIEYGNGSASGTVAGPGGPPGSPGGYAGGPNSGQPGPGGPSIDGWSYITVEATNGQYIGPIIN